MRNVLGWLSVVAASVGLGFVLYATSLHASPTTFEQSHVTPRPTPTVVKYRTKVVREPARPRVVTEKIYVPAPASPTESAPQSVGSATTPEDAGDTRIQALDDRGADEDVQSDHD